ncbi:hypothetical protein JCM8208_006191 [Rhodotorula glutinis]
MQQPYPPRLQINPPHFSASGSAGSMFGSPGGAMFASPAAYSGHPFGAGSMLSPEVLPRSSVFVPSPYGAAPAAPSHRQGSMASTVSPLTPVALSTLASPFFPSSAPPTRSPPTSLASTPRPYPQPYQSAPPRRTNLHAAAPSFHLPRDSSRSFFPASAPPPRGHGKRESVSVSALRVGDDPLRSPTLSRATSASPATSARRDEPRRKKVVVCIPREGAASDEEEADVEGVTGRVGQPRSTMRRAPLSRVERDEVRARVEAEGSAVDAASRRQHEDEVKMSELPPAIDVYLPGKDAWEEVWDQFEEEMVEKHGRCDARRPAFLPSSAPPSLDNLFPRRTGHGRTTSLFANPSAHLPPRLQSVVDSIRRVGSGHAPSLSLSLPASLAALRTPPLATSRSPVLASPSASPVSPAVVHLGTTTSSRRLTPLAESFVPSSSSSSRLRAAAATALPHSPPSSPEQALPAVVAGPLDEQGGEGLVAPNLARRLSEEHEQVIGSGAIINDDEPLVSVPDSGDELLFIASDDDPLVVDSDDEPLLLLSDDEAPLVLVDDDAPHSGRRAVVAHDAEPTPASRRRTTPSRSASGVSTKTDHTGVASQSGSAGSWSDVSEEEERASMRRGGEHGHAPALSHELSRALTDLGALEAHEVDEPARPASSHDMGVAVGVGASDDSQYGDGELSAAEHSHPSDDEAVRERADRRARSVRLHQSVESTTDDEDDKPLAMLALRPPASPLFQAPSDVDRTDHEGSTVEAPQHKVNLAFTFPPRSSRTSPVKARRRAVDVALPDSSPASSAQASPQLGSLDFGDMTLPDVNKSGFRRRTSEAPSPSSPVGFGPFGEPGSLAVSPSALADTPPVPRVDRTVVQKASRTPMSSTSSTRSALKATAVEFEPSTSAFLPTSFGTSSASSFDFFPPADAPHLPSDPVAAPPHVPTRHVSGSHGPLPPIPLTTVTPLPSTLKRRKGDDGDWVPAIASTSMRHISTPSLVHPQPRRPLPDPPSAFEGEASLEGDGGEVEVLRDEGDEAAGQEDSGSRSFMSSLSVDDPLPEQYAPTRPIGKKRAAAQDVAASRPFSLRAAPTLSADGRILGFHHDPSQRGAVSPFGAQEHEVQVSPARMGDPRAAREDSVDIALPSSLRAKSKAIPLSAARLKASDIFDGTFGVPDSPASSIVLNGSSSSVIEDDEDDLPLRILEDLISGHFDVLKAELVAARDQSRPDLEHLVDSIASRLEAVLVERQFTSRDGTLEIDRKLDEVHKRIEQLSAAAVERVEVAEPSGRPRRPTLLDVNRSLSAPPLRPSTPGLVEVGGPALAYSAFLDDLERIVQPLVHVPLDPSALAASVASALQPHLADVVERTTSSTSSSQVTVAEPVALEKVNRDSAFSDDDVNAIVVALETRLTCSSSRKNSDEQLEQAEAGFAVPSYLDSVRSALETVKAGQEQLLDTLQAHRPASSTFSGREQLEQVVEQVLKAVAPSTTSTDQARFSDLETQLAKARNEHGKARSEKAALQDRLEEVRARHTVEEVKLQARLEEQGKALERVEGEKQGAREALAASQGELTGLEKRVAAQDARLDALQRAKMVQQQSLALANQRNSSTATALAAARSRILELEAASSAADAEVNALDEANTAYRAQLASIQASLESLQVAVKSEHDEAALRIAQLTAERDRLADENERLVRAAYDGEEDAPPTPRQVVGPHLYPTPPSPPSLNNGLALVEQHTGDSDESDETVAHTDFSPTPSVSGQSVVQNDNDGWWSAVDA